MRRGDGVNGDRPEPDAATVERTLATIDSALETDHVTAVDPEERRLQELAIALRAESPGARPEFRERLDGRVARRFDSGEERRFGASLLTRLPRPSAPAIAGAGFVLIALVIGVSLYAGQGEVARDDEAGSAETGQPTVAPLEDGGGAVEDEVGASAERSVSPEGGQPLVRARENRRVERAAEMTLTAPNDELQDVSEGIATVVDRHDGFLLRSSLTTGDDAGGGRFDLRVPVEELDATIADLSALATVSSLTQSADDRTAGFLERQDALDDAEAELEELQADLALAETFSERQAIRAEIRSTREEIKSAEQAFERIRTQTSFSTVTVTLEEGEDGDAGLGTALADGIALLEDVVGFGLRALGVLVPLAVAAGFVWGGVASLRRRRRESALA